MRSRLPICPTLKGTVSSASSAEASCACQTARIVPHDQQDPARSVAGCQRDLNLCAAQMAVRISPRFLRDAEQG